MKKKELMKIDPPEFTPYLKRIAKKDGPVKSQYWGADKNYKYGKYLLFFSPAGPVIAITCYGKPSIIFIIVSF